VTDERPEHGRQGLLGGRSVRLSVVFISATAAVVLVWAVVLGLGYRHTDASGLSDGDSLPGGVPTASTAATNPAAADATGTTGTAGAPETTSVEAPPSAGSLVPAPISASPTSPTVQASRTPAQTTSADAGGVWIAQLASVPLSAGTAGLQKVENQVHQDVPDTRTLVSSDYASLRSGYYVIYRDGFTDGYAALAYCAAHGRTTANECIGRYLSHDAADATLICSPTNHPASRCVHG